MRSPFAAAVLFAALCLASRPSLADVTVTLAAGANDELDLTIAGDAVPVRFDLPGAQVFDWCRGVVSVPFIGLESANNDQLSSQAITLTGPLSTHCDTDPSLGFAGLTATVAGVSRAITPGVAVVFATSATVPTPQPPPATTFNGSAVLTWDAPKLYTDGTPLLDLASFKVYWGAAQGNYPNSSSVGRVTSYFVGGLAPGTWYFVVTALNSIGVESPFSNVASKVIKDPAPQPTTPPVPTTPPPPAAGPCDLRPLTFSVKTWPAADTGSRSLGYSSNKRLASFSYAWTGTRLTKISATDFEGCTAESSR